MSALNSRTASFFSTTSSTKSLGHSHSHHLFEVIIMVRSFCFEAGPDGRLRFVEQPPTTWPRPPLRSFAGFPRRSSSSPSPSHRSPAAAATHAASPLQPQHDGNLDSASTVLSPSDVVSATLPAVEPTTSSSPVPTAPQAPAPNEPCTNLGCCHHLGANLGSCDQPGPNLGSRVEPVSSAAQSASPSGASEAPGPSSNVQGGTQGQTDKSCVSPETAAAREHLTIRHWPKTGCASCKAAKVVCESPEPGSRMEKCKRCSQKYRTCTLKWILEMSRVKRLTGLLQGSDLTRDSPEFLAAEREIYKGVRELGGPMDACKDYPPLAPVLNAARVEEPQLPPNPVAPQHARSGHSLVAPLATRSKKRTFDDMTEGHQAPSLDDLAAGYAVLWSVMRDFYTELERMGDNPGDQRLHGPLERGMQRIWDLMRFNFNWDMAIGRS